MSLEEMLKERDFQEEFESKYNPFKLPEIERNDELDYEIRRVLEA